MKPHPLVALVLVCGPLGAQEESADPYTTGGAEKTASNEAGGQTEPNYSICYEAFSLPLATAAKWRRESPSGSRLYDQVVAALEDDGVRQEALVIQATRDREKTVNEGIREEIYPTTWESARVPENVSLTLMDPLSGETSTPPRDEEQTSEKLDRGLACELRTSAIGGSYETRNTGVTVETLANEADGNLVDLSYAVEHVTLVRRSTWGQGVSTTQMPIFEQQGINSSSTVRLNEPFLLGTISRPPDSEVNPDSANRTWLAFVTVSEAGP